MAANHHGPTASTGVNSHVPRSLSSAAIPAKNTPAKTSPPPQTQTAKGRQSFVAQGDSTTSGTVAVNAAFMWEVKSVNEDLWHVVELVQTLCKRPHVIQRRAKKLVGLLEQLLDLVGMQFTLEEAYGYFDDPEHVEPQVSFEAVKLRNEHATLYQSLMQLVDRAQECFFDGDDDGMLYRIPSQFHVFLEQFREHDQRECALTLSAMNQDIGVGD